MLLFLYAYFLASFTVRSKAIVLMFVGRNILYLSIASNASDVVNSKEKRMVGFDSTVKVATMPGQKCVLLSEVRHERPRRQTATIGLANMRRVSRGSGCGQEPLFLQA